MTKLPWIQLFFDDLDRDCSALSLAARGAWMWIIGDLHHQGGERSLTLEGWSRVIRASVQQTAVVLDEIIASHTCDSNVTEASRGDALSQKSDALISVKCRRIVREYKARQKHVLRQQRYRKKQLNDGSVDVGLTPKKLEAKNLESPLPPFGGNGNASASAFKILLESYPAHRRTKTQEAATEFAALNPDSVLLAKMIAALEVQKASEEWQRENGRYVPGVEKWLRGHCWEGLETQEEEIVPDPPGSDPRPPKGCDWARDETGAIIHPMRVVRIDEGT